MLKSEKTRVQKAQCEPYQESADWLQGETNIEYLNAALEKERNKAAYGSYREARRYNALYKSAFSSLPEEATVNETPAPAENLSYKERRKKKKNF